MYLDSAHSFSIINSYAFSCYKERERKEKKKKFPRWFTEKQNNPQTHSTGCLLRLKANSTTAPKNKGSSSPFL